MQISILETILKTNVNIWVENLRIQCDAHVVRMDTNSFSNNLADPFTHFDLQYAERLNKIIVENCRFTRLVVLELPKIPQIKNALYEYFEYVEILTMNLNRVLMIKGDGQNVISYH